MQLHDNSISHIAKIVQLAILTGTDIVDNLRAMQFVLTDDQMLDVNAEYVATFEDNLNKLVQQALSQDLTSDTSES
jgi:hypothetical protein